MYLIRHKERLVTQKWARKRLWKEKDGVLTHKLCPACKEWRDVNEYPLHKLSMGWRVDGRCLYCRAEYYREYGTERRRRANIKPRVYMEERFTVRDGLRGLVCPKCREWKPVVDYVTKYLETGRETVQNSVCRPCKSAQSARRFLLRRVWETFGENSPQYRLAENEKRNNHLKALCKVWGILSDSGIRFKGKRQVRGILPGMSVGEVTFEEAWREALARVEEAEARRRPTQVKVHEMRAL